MINNIFILSLIQGNSPIRSHGILKAILKDRNLPLLFGMFHNCMPRLFRLSISIEELVDVIKDQEVLEDRTEQFARWETQVSQA